jgi:outer membrane protein OmpA-like peptidoglycan-associated protein
MFKTSHAELSPNNKAKLPKTAQNLMKPLKRYPVFTVRISGHTDAIGKESDNQKLGQEEADAVPTL